MTTARTFIAAVLVLCWIPQVQAMESYSNPVIEESFSIKTPKFTTTIGIGDPTVLLHEGVYYLYPTGDNYSFSVYTSSDLVNWKKGPKVFQSKEPYTWAPDVYFHKDDGKFYLYYSANMRVGVAVADKPTGPFKDIKTLRSKAIDAHMFRDDDGSLFLYFASYPALEIYVQKMSAPTETLGEPVKLISPELSWERKFINVTEAPWMLKHRGIYYLLYSGGGSDSEDYAIGYATSAKSPMGPFVKHLQNPIVKKGAGVFGPGHTSITTDSTGALWMIYHQKHESSRGWNRFIAIDSIWFNDDGALEATPTRGTSMPSPEMQ